MKYLLPPFWYKFGEATGKKDGSLFEELVGDILALEYGSSSWTQTGTTWDGSKDFYFYSEEKRLWAECKNYRSKISLNVLSSTLIMAQIEHVDEILIFSYSPLKLPVYEKIVKYTDVSGKLVKIYEDEALENLIFYHREKLLSKYFPTFSFDLIDWELSKPTIICSVIKDPLLAYSIEDDVKIIPNSPGTIDFNTILCLYISIHNKNKDILLVDVECNWKKDSRFFEFLGGELNKKILEVPPYSTSAIKFFFRVVNYKKIIELPYAIVNYQYTNIKSDQTIISFKPARCNWLGDTILIGQSYENILKRFSSQSINRKVFSALHIYGTSGTGKSRIINEAVAVGLKNGYRIIKFSIEHFSKNKSENKIVWLIKELVYALYNIPDLDSEIDYDFIDKYQGYNQVFELLKKINSLDLNSNIENEIGKYAETIAAKLCETKCFIIFDNVQYFPENFNRFLEMIFSYSIIRNRKCLFAAIVCFNISHMSSKSAAMDLNFFFKQYSKSTPSIISWHLKGFVEKNEARVYFNQLLSRSANIAEKYINKFLERTANNPYYIKSTISWLEKNGWLVCSDGHYEIKNYREFYRIIDTLPENIEEMILHRWTYFIEHKEDINVYLLILSIIHFYGKIDWLKMQQFQIKESFIYELEYYEFIKRVENKRKDYCFYHDIVEDFFCKQYYPLSEIAIHNYISLDLLVEKEASQEKYLELIKVMQGRTSILPIEAFCNIDDIPLKWCSEYLDLLMELHLKHLNKFKNWKHWIQVATSLCSKTREFEGTKRALCFFDRVYHKCLTEKRLYDEISFGWFIITYGNVLYEAGRVDDAIKYTKKYWETHKWNTENENESRVLGYVINRLHVYKRYNTSVPLQNREVIKLLKLSDSISLIHDDNEIKYVNLIDYGCCGYSSKEHKKHILQNFEKACTLFESKDIPQKTMNHIKAQIKIALIKRDTSKVIELCNYGIDYAVNGKHAYYKGFFSEYFYLYMASAYLINEDVNNTESALVEAEEIDFILSLRVQWIILWLKSIKFYINHENYKALQYVEEAYISLYNTPKKTYKQDFLDQISSNYKLIASYCILSEENLPTVNVSALKPYYAIIKKYSKDEASKYIDSCEANSNITSLNNKINFPCF